MAVAVQERPAILSLEWEKSPAYQTASKRLKELEGDLEGQRQLAARLRAEYKQAIGTDTEKSLRAKDLVHPGSQSAMLEKLEKLRGQIQNADERVEALADACELVQGEVTKAKAASLEVITANCRREHGRLFEKIISTLDDLLAVWDEESEFEDRMARHGIPRDSLESLGTYNLNTQQRDGFSQRVAALRKAGYIV